jgi:hypothetical protein
MLMYIQKVLDLLRFLISSGSGSLSGFLDLFFGQNSDPRQALLVIASVKYLVHFGT